MIDLDNTREEAVNIAELKSARDCTPAPKLSKLTDDDCTFAKSRTIIDSSRMSSTNNGKSLDAEKLSSKLVKPLLQSKSSPNKTSVYDNFLSTLRYESLNFIILLIISMHLNIRIACIHIKQKHTHLSRKTHIHCSHKKAQINEPMYTNLGKSCIYFTTTKLHRTLTFMHLNIPTTHVYIKIWTIAWPTQKTTSDHQKINHRMTSSHRRTDLDRVKT